MQGRIHDLGAKNSDRYFNLGFSHDCRARPDAIHGPADRAVAQMISNALVKAGIDPRTTSVQVITTSDHAVYLTGLIGDQNRIKLAGETAAKAAPSWRVVNNIRSSFFDDPNHVRGDKTK